MSFVLATPKRKGAEPKMAATSCCSLAMFGQADALRCARRNKNNPNNRNNDNGFRLVRVANQGRSKRVHREVVTHDAGHLRMAGRQADHASTSSAAMTGALLLARPARRGVKQTKRPLVSQVRSLESETRMAAGKCGNDNPQNPACELNIYTLFLHEQVLELSKY